MSDVYRYRYGESNPQAIPFKYANSPTWSGIAIAVGDMVYEDVSANETNIVGCVKPLTQLPAFTLGPATLGGALNTLVQGVDNHTITGLSTYFAGQQFAGVSAQRFDGVNNLGYGIKDLKLRIDTSGYFDLDVGLNAGQTNGTFATTGLVFRVGDLVAPDVSGASGTVNFLSQTVFNLTALIAVSGGALLTLPGTATLKNLAIGRVVMPVTLTQQGATRVRVQLFPGRTQLNVNS